MRSTGDGEYIHRTAAYPRFCSSNGYISAMECAFSSESAIKRRTDVRLDILLLGDFVPCDLLGIFLYIFALFLCLTRVSFFNRGVDQRNGKKCVYICERK